MDDQSFRCLLCAGAGCLVLLVACESASAVEKATPRASAEANASLPTLPKKVGPLLGQVGSAYAAQQHIDYAEDLVKRGAVHTAEEEFTKALWVVAQARQLADPKSSCTRSLATALIALDEAEDFSPSVAARALEPDLHMVAVGHRTPVLRELPDETQLTALGAIQRYYNYAREHLTTALGNEPAASRALFGLGRLQQILPSDSPVGNRFSQAKSMTMHLAAVQVDPKNFKSANELGVLLARYGRPNEAKKAFRQSLAVFPTPTAWHNLAKVCETLGDERTAEHARGQHALLAKKQESETSSGAPIRWVTLAAFASTSDLPAGVEAKVSASVDSKDLQPKMAAASKVPWHKKMINGLFSKDSHKKNPKATYVGRAGERVQKR